VRAALACHSGSFWSAAIVFGREPEPRLLFGQFRFAQRVRYGLAAVTINAATAMFARSYVRSSSSEWSNAARPVMVTTATSFRQQFRQHPVRTMADNRPVVGDRLRTTLPSTDGREHRRTLSNTVDRKVVWLRIPPSAPSLREAELRESVMRNRAITASTAALWALLNIASPVFADQEYAGPPVRIDLGLVVVLTVIGLSVFGLALRGLNRGG
jgi:hypothetical protein